MRRAQGVQRSYLGVMYYLCRFVFQFPGRHNMDGIREAVLLFHVKHECPWSCESSSGMRSRQCSNKPHPSPRRRRE